MMWTTVDHDRHLIKVVGEVDVASSAQLLEAVSAIGAPHCQVDLTDVTFLDAGGIAVLVRAGQARRQVGGSLTLIGAAGLVAEVLYLTGVAESLGLPMRAPTPGARSNAKKRGTDGHTAD